MSSTPNEDRRKAALEAIQRLRAEVRARNEDLTEDDADAIAAEISAEAMARVSARADARRGAQVYRQWQPGRTKIVSATEAKNRLGALLAELTNGTSTIVIEHHGHPRAVMISADEWAALSAARERMLRQDAWEQLWTLAAEASVHNADLTPEDADAIADLIGDEAKRRVARRAAMS